MFNVGSVMAECNQCNKCINNMNYNSVQCMYCKSMYHKTRVYGNLDDGLCFKCSGYIFPFNHILDNDEFLFTVHYFNNDHDYNKLLDLKFNPFLFDTGFNDLLHDHLQNHGVSTSCNYVFDPSEFNVSFKSGFSVLHLNVRSFNKNQDLINAFIYNLNFTFSTIALSETWFKEDHSNLLNIQNYNMVSIPRQGRRSGGTALYVHDSLSFKDRPDLNLIQAVRNDIDHSESVFIEITRPQSKNIIVGNVYRAHRTDIDSFNSDLSNCLDRISLENKLSYISGDFNLDFLHHDIDNKVNDFLNNFYSHDMFPLIDRPTRIVKNSATLLDNIIHNCS